MLLFNNTLCIYISLFNIYDSISVCYLDNFWIEILKKMLYNIPYIKWTILHIGDK